MLVFGDACGFEGELCFLTSTTRIDPRLCRGNYCVAQFSGVCFLNVTIFQVLCHSYFLSCSFVTYSNGKRCGHTANVRVCVLVAELLSSHACTNDIPMTKTLSLLLPVSDSPLLVTIYRTALLLAWGPPAGGCVGGEGAHTQSSGLGTPSYVAA